jgi:hypothetical protein
MLQSSTARTLPTVHLWIMDAPGHAAGEGRQSAPQPDGSNAPEHAAQSCTYGATWAVIVVIWMCTICLQLGQQRRMRSLTAQRARWPCAQGATSLMGWVMPRHSGSQLTLSAAEARIKELLQSGTMRLVETTLEGQNDAAPMPVTHCLDNSLVEQRFCVDLHKHNLQCLTSK